VSLWDLSRLTPSDFEDVCRDLLSLEFGVHLESFPDGRDGGVDLRYMSPADADTLIVQCKHWIRTGTAKLIKHMSDVERAKIEALDPERYVLCTSVGLTPDNKKTIMASLQPWILSTGDIYGVVRQHPRLWMAAASVLSAIVNNRIHQRSKALSLDADHALKIFVPHEGMERATQLLARDHVCLLTGVPGVGKTTLAQVLAAQYAELGYEIVDVGSDIDEANSVWDSESQQFFYYDDFLGQVSLGDNNLSKNEDRRIVEFMRRVERNKNKRLVLTTRGYILEHAKQRYERLATANFSPLSCVVSLAQYTRPLRAQMVFNHAYFSALDNDTRHALSSREYYQPIVDHKNFNPRLIELSLRRVEQSGLQGHEAAELFAQLLTEPREIWDFVLERHLDYAETALLEVIASGPVQWNLSEVPQAWTALMNELGAAVAAHTFRDAVAAMDGSLISLSNAGTGTFVTLINPSLRDHIRTRLSEDEAAITRLLTASLYFEQLVFLAEICSNTSWLDGLAALWEDALRRTSQATPLDTPYHAVIRPQRLSRFKQLVAWGERGSACAAELASQIAREVMTDSSGEVLAEAARTLASSTLSLPDQDDLIRDLTRSALEDIDAVLDSVEQISWAQSVLSELGDLAQPSSVDRIRERFDDLIRGALEDLSRLDPDDDDLPENVDDLVSTAADDFPWIATDYQEVIAYVRETAQERNGPDPDGDYDAWKDSQHSAACDDSFDSLFASLRDF
jgi:Restriction endonuclease